MVNTNPYKALTEYEMMEKLKNARENAKNGIVKDAKEVSNNMRQKYRSTTWNRRLEGTEQETKVQEYLQEKGYEILTRNFYTKHGEIDLIAKKDGYLVFVEVKYRADMRYGAPEEAVDFRKQRKIIAAAQYYLYKNRIPFDTPCRFDVAGVMGNEIRITENAFGM